jgi:hypothetical protein
VIEAFTTPEAKVKATPVFLKVNTSPADTVIIASPTNSVALIMVEYCVSGNGVPFNVNTIEFNTAAEAVVVKPTL